MGSACFARPPAMTEIAGLAAYMERRGIRRLKELSASGPRY